MNEGRNSDGRHHERAAAVRLNRELSESQPAQREGDLTVQNHGLKDVVGADVARLGGQHQDNCYQSCDGAQLGPDAPRKAVDPGHVAAKVNTKIRNSPAESPSGRVTRSRTKSQPRCGLNASNRCDERIVGVQLRILSVQQQGQPVCLVAVEAVVASKGQVETQENRKDEPTRWLAWSGEGCPQTSPGSFPTRARGEFASRPGREFTRSVPRPKLSVNVSSRCRPQPFQRPSIGCRLFRSLFRRLLREGRTRC